MWEPVHIGWVELVGGPRDGEVLKAPLAPAIELPIEATLRMVPDENVTSRVERLVYVREKPKPGDEFIGDHEHPYRYQFMRRTR